MEFSLRPIRPEDNLAIAQAIRNVLEEFGVNRPGTAYYDDALNHMAEFYSIPKSIYYVGLIDEKIVGGGGIYPTIGLPNDTCELVKMYLLPEARGMGLGKAIFTQCIGFAKENGYRKIYLETMPELQKAVSLYERFGFRHLTHHMGSTGHYACEIRMLYEMV